MRKTAEQRFAAIFAVYMDRNAPQGERDAAERKIDKWLEQRGKTRADIPAILAQALQDDAAANPPPPPPDPRDSTVHPFDNSQFTPLGLVVGLVGKYVTMQADARVVYAAWICFTHVYHRR